MWARRYLPQIQFILLLTLVAALPLSALQVFAQEESATGAVMEKSARERDLRDQLQKILHELEELQQAPAGGATAAPVQPSVLQEPSEAKAAEAIPQFELADVSIVSDRVQRRPEGITLSATEQSETESQPTRTLRESMESLPGVVLRQANGPRDFSISIRGSGVKTSFAVREIKMYEDGFIQTQSDGLSRLDIHDPWFMRSVEVTRGASSSLYDNYALGGMVHFRTRRGSDINGMESFISGGSYGYQKYGFAVGQQFDNVDISLFGSHVSEDGFIRHSDYSTQTMNFNFRVKVDDKQNLYFKAITNWLDSRVPTRLTLSQFDADHRQAGGINNATNAVLLGQRRLDRRNIIGGMYERQIDANTVLTMEADYDVKDINQTFTQISDNINPNYKHYTDLRHDGRLFDMPLRSYVGFFVNQMEQEGQTFNNLQDFFGTRGTLAQNSRGHDSEHRRAVPGRIGVYSEVDPCRRARIRAIAVERADDQLHRRGGEWSVRSGTELQQLGAGNVVSWKPADGYRHWVRASTGYAIPGFGNLLTNPFTGLAGTNFDLKPQKNLNVELGTESRSAQDLDRAISRLCHVRQRRNHHAGRVQYRRSGGDQCGLVAISRHRVVLRLAAVGRVAALRRLYAHRCEVHQLQRPVPGRRLPTAFVRDGKVVPNVPTDTFNFKESYDHAASGWGGWVEVNYMNSYFLNNNNTVGIPSFVIANLNIHKNFEFQNNKWIRFAKFFAEIDNIADKKYAASGNVVADSTADANKTLFFAGYGRSFYAGVTLGLF
jgi:iron complex outermembrane receptor protein